MRPVGAFWCLLGRLGAVLGPSWGGLRGILGGFLGVSLAVLGPCWPSLAARKSPQRGRRRPATASQQPEAGLGQPRVPEAFRAPQIPRDA
eukprot:3491620-Pyramimonas_sp.AAC.1